jgi:ankyrin repeat protein
MKRIDKQNVLGESELKIACTNDAMQKVKRLLVKGADPNISDVNGITPLMEAASGGALEIVQLLIAYGADPHRQDNFGDTALIYARNQGFKKVAHYLKLIMSRRVK